MTPAPSTAPQEAGSARRSYVRGMFSAIAPRYDLLNHALSLNTDRRWRRQAVNALGWQSAPSGTYLDLCAGTLDLSVELVRRPGFTRKAPEVQVLGADALELPFAQRTFDGCMVAFGVRNLVDLDRGLGEIARVLKPGARAVILDFAFPAAWPLKPLYLFYFRRVLPRIGRLVSKHTSAYQYLPDSVAEFPSPEALCDRMVAAGFSRVAFQRLTFGIATLVWGLKA
ncbi:MAG: class I SAM-dependent methyltransferase [Gemmatimonadetes bacterium]|nr:class I SAM-dependent methyltransferase [Gemmatimonadota bacterium]